MAEAEGTATTTEQPQKGALARLAQLAWQALPAVAGAISLIGFVTLVGGAIQWVRFFSAGLPADQAVRAVPKQELVVIGAVSLVGVAIVGVLAVLLLYLLDKRGNATPRTLRGVFILGLVEVIAPLFFLDIPVRERIVLGVVSAVVVVLGYLAVMDLPKLLDDRREAARTRKSADDALRSAAAAYRDAADRYADAFFHAKLPPFPDPRQLAAGTSTANTEGLPPNVDRPLVVALRQSAADLNRAMRDWPRAVARWRRAAPEEEKEHRAKAAETLTEGGAPSDEELDEACSPPKPKTDGEENGEERRDDEAVQERIWRLNVLALRACVAAVVVAGVVFLAVLGGDAERLLAILLVIAVLLGAATFAVAYVTANFAWYGITAFAALILFGALLNIGIAILDPKVQPVALVRANDPAALCGVYVTETDDRVYIGRVQRDEGEGELGADGGAGRMFWIPTEDIEVVTVGPLQNIRDAQDRALELTREVQADRPPAVTAPRTYKETVEHREDGAGRDKKVTTRTAVHDRLEQEPEKDESEPVKNLWCRTADITEAVLERERDKLKPAARTTPSRQDP